MADWKSVQFEDRGVIEVTGRDAQKLLQGIVTNDMAALTQPGQALHTGLLSPQGKILFDFFVVRHGDGYLIDTDRDSVEALMKRLALYKLRADAAIRDASDTYTVAAVWDCHADSIAGGIDCVAFHDPRLSALGMRLLTHKVPGAKLDMTPDRLSRQDYDRRRIAFGVPEAGRDFDLGDTFPHEALYDQLGGVSFSKGCFVGQEVVSRMQHRGTARRRIVQVAAEDGIELPMRGAEVRAGPAVIGRLGTTAGAQGLAMLRLDRVAEANAKGVAVMAGEVPLQVSIPNWATFALPDVSGGSGPAAGSQE